MYIPALQNNFGSYTVLPPMVKELDSSPLYKKKIVKIALTISVGVCLFLNLVGGFAGAAMFGS